MKSVMERARFIVFRIGAHCVGLALFLVIAFEMLSWLAVGTGMAAGMNWSAAVAFSQSLPGLFDLPPFALAMGLAVMFAFLVPPVALLLKLGISPWLSAPFVTVAALLVAVASGLVPVSVDSIARSSALAFLPGFVCCSLPSLVWVWIAYGSPKEIRARESEEDLATVF